MRVARCGEQDYKLGRCAVADFRRRDCGIGTKLAAAINLPPMVTRDRERFDRQPCPTGTTFQRSGRPGLWAMRGNECGLDRLWDYVNNVSGDCYVDMGNWWYKASVGYSSAVTRLKARIVGDKTYFNASAIGSLLNTARQTSMYLEDSYVTPCCCPPPGPPVCWTSIPGYVHTSNVLPWIRPLGMTHSPGSPPQWDYASVITAGQPDAGKVLIELRLNYPVPQALLKTMSVEKLYELLAAHGGDGGATISGFSSSISGRAYDFNVLRSHSLSQTWWAQSNIQARLSPGVYNIECKFQWTEKESIDGWSLEVHETCLNYGEDYAVEYTFAEWSTVCGFGNLPWGPK